LPANVLPVNDLPVNDLPVNDLRVEDLRVNGVFTTGTTMSVRVPVLGGAGAALVYAAAVARARKADRIGIQREVREAA
jgi:hypothetical protein